MAGRPRNFDREEALEQAINAFWAHGYENTSISQLTEVMGIAPPSLYAAFGDKRALFDEAAACYCDRLAARMTNALAARSTRDAIGRVLRTTADFHSAGGHPAGCLAMSEPLLAEKRAELRRAISARIARGVAETELPESTDVDGLAEFVMVLLTGMSERARDGATTAQLEATITHAMASWPSGQAGPSVTRSPQRAKGAPGNPGTPCQHPLKAVPPVSSS
jgi:AcrR family transcriptional regulator